MRDAAAERLSARRPRALRPARSSSLGSGRPLFLVLAHLGLVPFVACKTEDTHVVDPTTLSTALKPGECHTDPDCGAPYIECLHLAGPDAIGHCEYRKDYNLGRPLVVDGVAYVAPYAETRECSEEVVAALKRAAREEHASIAAFARTISELMALGAPTWLLFETQAALADEIRHTELTLDAIERLTGERLVLGSLPEAAFALRSGPEAAAELFRDVFRGGAVCESMAAALAERQRDEAKTAELRGLYETICVDEARHAALAFKTLRWLLDAKPELTSVLEEERLRLESKGSLEERTLCESIHNPWMSAVRS